MKRILFLACLACIGCKKDLSLKDDKPSINFENEVDASFNEDYGAAHFFSFYLEWADSSHQTIRWVWQKDSERPDTSIFSAKGWEHWYPYLDGQPEHDLSKKVKNQ